MPLPVTLAAIQLLVGVPYAWTLWLTGMRKAPKFSLSKVPQRWTTSRPRFVSFPPVCMNHESRMDKSK